MTQSILPTNKTLGVIGAGVMGRALVQGILSRGVLPPEQVWAADKIEASCERMRADFKIQAATQYKDFLPDTDILLLCVKPRGLKSAVDKLKANGLRPHTMIISILAGVSIAQIEEALGTQNPVIRAMTNTPCIVGEGMTCICAGTHATGEQLALTDAIFHSVGKCMTLEETHFDAVTGLSGSGPAYLYLIMEALADGGVRVGLPRHAALEIVAQTVLGAAKMVKETGRHPAALRDDVTTPAGCTIGALLVMEDGKIRSVLARAVEEAAKIASGLA